MDDKQIGVTWNYAIGIALSWTPSKDDLDEDPFSGGCST